jgi:hypothetical protein
MRRIIILKWDNEPVGIYMRFVVNAGNTDKNRITLMQAESGRDTYSPRRLASSERISTNANKVG